MKLTQLKKLINSCQACYIFSIEIVIANGQVYREGGMEWASTNGFMLQWDLCLSHPGY